MSGKNAALMRNQRTNDDLDLAKKVVNSLFNDVSNRGNAPITSPKSFTREHSIASLGKRKRCCRPCAISAVAASKFIQETDLYGSTSYSPGGRPVRHCDLWRFWRSDDKKAPPFALLTLDRTISYQHISASSGSLGDPFRMRSSEISSAKISPNLVRSQSIPISGANSGSASRIVRVNSIILRLTKSWQRP